MLIWVTAVRGETVDTAARGAKAEAVAMKAIAKIMREATKEVDFMVRRIDDNYDLIGGALGEIVSF